MTTSFFKKISLPKKGFALVFTIVIVGIILALALVIADISYRQALLSNLAKDSQVAFYQADAALECGLYYDVGKNDFPPGTTLSKQTINAIVCGGKSYLYDPDRSKDDYFVFTDQKVQQTTAPCFQITFDKTQPNKKNIKGDGFNNCTLSDRQVERTLSVTY